MKNILRTSVLALATTAVGIAAAPERAHAQTYQIDCAILLCLSGGWPASVPCARARAEFIRRITPWPVEPPLQIWRCPMGAAYTVDPETLTADRIYDILLELDDAPQQSFPSAPLTEPQPAVVRRSGGSAERLDEDAMLHLIQDFTEGDGQADIDIAGADFNFVRSIRVFAIRYARQWEHGEDNDCDRWFSARLGTYGTQGDFRWQSFEVDDLPDEHIGLEQWRVGCPSIYHRSVFVEWRDYEGNYGFEQVNY